MKQLLKNIWTINFAIFTFFLGIMIAAPIFSPFAVQLGATPLILGIVSALTSLVAIIMRPIFGLISDRGYRIEVMILGCILICIASLTYYFSSNIWIYAIARIIHGFAAASFFPSSISIIIDLSPVNRIGEFLGWRSTMFGISQFIGPAIGGYISDLYNSYNVNFIFTFMLALISLITLILAYRVIKIQLRKRIKSNNEFLSGLKFIRELFNLKFICASISTNLHAISFSALYTFLPAMYKNLGYSATIYGLYSSIQGGCSIITRAFGGKIADKRGAIPTVSIGLILTIISYILLILFYKPPIAYICSAIFGFGLGLIVPSMQLLALGDLPSNIRGFASGIFTMAYDSGFLIGPILFGYIIELTGNYISILNLFPIFPLIALIIVQIPRIKS